MLQSVDNPCSVGGSNLANPPNIDPLALLLNISSNADFGAVSRKSIDSYLPSAERIRAKPPPPRPLWWLSEPHQHLHPFGGVERALPITPMQRTEPMSYATR